MKVTSLPFADRFTDLHLHLDGAVTPAIAKQLADMQDIPLPPDDELEKLLTVSPDCRDLNEFLSCFSLPQKLLQNYAALTECTCLVTSGLASQQVVYAELRFAPQLHCIDGMSQEDAVRAVLEGLEKSPVRGNIILCFMRGGSIEDNTETLRLAKKYLTADGGVTALDLAGAEALFPTADYRGLFEEARRLGIPFTIHAGEADGAHSVREAIEMGACRIGHGVRTFEDDALVSLAAERGIPFEMCPTSNRITRAVADMENYPFNDYIARGIPVTINTDDPAIERTTIAVEYRYMEEVFGLTAQQERVLLANSIEAAFTTDRGRADIKRSLGLDSEVL
ncbi:adenosine deaminase [uncultured Ruminococcus sp.]|uniref:adenosine deaminase n=1 Tax=uncultured Ruminococcus sp. TaxID=165186 RepID=UPI0025D9B07A|nr:adenosine deaminase [uncultured Ruminococcus sp.]